MQWVREDRGDGSGERRYRLLPTGGGLAAGAPRAAKVEKGAGRPQASAQASAQASSSAGRAANGASATPQQGAALPAKEGVDIEQNCPVGGTGGEAKQASRPVHNLFKRAGVVDHVGGASASAAAGDGARNGARGGTVLASDQAMPSTSGDGLPGSTASIGLVGGVAVYNGPRMLAVGVDDFCLVCAQVTDDREAARIVLCDREQCASEVPMDAANCGISKASHLDSSPCDFSHRRFTSTASGSARCPTTSGFAAINATAGLAGTKSPSCSFMKQLSPYPQLAPQGAGERSRTAPSRMPAPPRAHSATGILATGVGLVSQQRCEIGPFLLHTG